MAEAFTGFPPSGIDFLAGLAADNSKDGARWRSWPMTANLKMY